MGTRHQSKHLAPQSYLTNKLRNGVQEFQPTVNELKILNIIFDRQTSRKVVTIVTLCVIGNAALVKSAVL